MIVIEFFLASTISEFLLSIAEETTIRLAPFIFNFECPMNTFAPSFLIFVNSCEPFKSEPDTL